MPSRTAWRNLLPGLIALAALVLITVGVLVFAGIGQIRGKTTKLYVLTDQARGVMRGTEVWIAGQKVGAVDGVDFRPPSSDSLGQVVISITVKRSAVPLIRQNSRAEIRSGMNIIGPIVVHLTQGSADRPMVQAGDTILAGTQSDFAVATQKLSAATAELGPIMTDVRTIIGNVRNPNGTVGALLRGGLGANVQRLRLQVNRVRARFATHDGNGDGDGGSMTASVMERARIAMAHADSIRALLASSETSFGRFRRDSSLQGTIGRVRDELTELRASLEQNDGTLARVQRDSALVRSVAVAQREMAALFADVRRRPMRYIQF